MESVQDVLEASVYDDSLFYQLFDEAERVRWTMHGCAWSSIDVKEVSPAWIVVARETLATELTTFNATERFFADFGSDVDFTQWLTVWLYEETKHPSAILKWLDTVGEKFDSRFMLQGRVAMPFMPDKLGTLATNIISELVAATMYTTITSRPDMEPVLKQIFRNLAGDEARHAASFYRYTQKYFALSENRTNSSLALLKVLYAWITPDLKARVGHPISLVTHRFKTTPSLQEAIPWEIMGGSIDTAFKRAIRVFGTLLEMPLRDTKDVEDQLAALRR